MAHRRVLVRGKLTGLVLATVLLTLLLAGSVHVSNQTSLMRAQMAALESSRKFEEGRRAALLTAWNHAAASETVVPRARREIGLELRDAPGLVLVRHTADSRGDGAGMLQRILSRFGGGEAQAAVQPASDAPTGLVSLVPRQVRQPVTGTVAAR